MTDLNEMAVELAEELRSRALDEIVDLDVRVMQKNRERQELRIKIAEADEDANMLFNMRRNKEALVRALDDDIRELKRPREGFPDLNDEEYEMRKENLRVAVGEAASL
jgi:hypothetical protein